MTPDLFIDETHGAIFALGAKAFVLRALALPYVDDLLSSLATIEAAAPFRQMLVPGGAAMSVAMTNTSRPGS
jgi:alkylated DNA repair protein (DNA oxidative demethylase)